MLKVADDKTIKDIPGMAVSIELVELFKRQEIIFLEAMDELNKYISCKEELNKPTERDE